MVSRIEKFTSQEMDTIPQEYAKWSHSYEVSRFEILVLGLGLGAFMQH